VQYVLFDTALGPVGIGWGPAGVLAVQLPEATRSATAARMLRWHPDAEEASGEPPVAVARAIERIVALLAGEHEDLREVPLDMSAVPDFDRRVYEVAREVEAGDTTTYGEIAGRLGAPHASREVGQALGHNPFPLIVPCHRVLAAGGRLGGFSARGGVTTKLRLLDIEGAEPNGQPALF
jgi:methylated-DNA-[protein]-cysteine S-methyltransferase